MQYPTFFDEVEEIILEDELSKFLGATSDGKIIISYLDCVKLAGHSCPTVASSYILAKVALNELFKEETPKRAMVKIEIKNAKSDGVTGVIGSILGYIFGSSDEGGFSGIGGKFNRRGLIEYNCNIESEFKFTRLDNQKSANFSIDLSQVPPNPKTKELMQKALSGTATNQEIIEFQNLWQDRVKKMLLNKSLYNKIAVKEF